MKKLYSNFHQTIQCCDNSKKGQFVLAICKGQTISEQELRCPYCKQVKAIYLDSRSFYEVIP